MPDSEVKRERSGVGGDAGSGTQAPQQRPILPRGAAAAPPPSAAVAVASAAASEKPVFTHVQFGFAEIDGVSIPKIFRGEQTAYVVVWMVELKLLWRFPNNYPAELKKRPPLRSSYMSEDEGLLVNEINETHCLSEYGRHDFSKRDNMLVKFDEFMDFYLAVRRCFPDIADSRSVGITLEELNQMKGGFVQIDNVVCPFVYRKDIRFVPHAYLQHTGVRLGLRSGLGGFGFFPSPKECGFLNSVALRLNLKVQVGMLSKMLALDMVERLAECVVRELNTTNPFASAQYVVNPSELRLCNSAVRVTPGSAPVLNVMAVNQAAMISVAPAATVGTSAAFASNGVPLFNGAAPLPRGSQTVGGQAPAASTVRGRRPGTANQQQQQQQQRYGRQQRTRAAAASSEQPPQKRRRHNCDPQVTKQVVKETRLGTCSLVKVQGDLTGGKQISLCALRPCAGLLPDNANQGDYVVLEHARRSLFPLWPAEKMLGVLCCLVPTSKIYAIAESLLALFEEAFCIKLQSRENALLHLEIFLKNLHYLQSRYAESLPLAENQQLARAPAPKPMSLGSQQQHQLYSQIDSMHSVLANIGVSSQLRQQAVDVIQID